MIQDDKEQKCEVERVLARCGTNSATARAQILRDVELNTIVDRTQTL